MIDPSFYVNRGEAFALLSDFSNAVANFRHAVKLDSHNKEIVRRLGTLIYVYSQLMLDGRRWKEAIWLMDEAIKREPHVVHYWMQRALGWIGLGKYDQAQKDLDHCKVLDANQPDVYVVKAKLYLLQGDSKQAYTENRRALELKPGHPAAESIAADIAQESITLRDDAMEGLLSGDYEAALLSLDSAVQVCPGDRELLLKRALALYKLDRFDDAVADLKNCMETFGEEKDIVERWANIHNDQAMHLMANGEISHAITLYNRAIRKCRHLPLVFVNRGDAFNAQGQQQLALADYHQALDLDPKLQGAKARLAVLHNAFGMDLYNHQSYRQAIYEFNTAIELHEFVALYHVNKSECFIRMQRFEDATKELLRAVEIDPRDRRAQILLSQLVSGEDLARLLKTPTESQLVAAEDPVFHKVAVSTAKRASKPHPSLKLVEARKKNDRVFRSFMREGPRH